MFSRIGRYSINCAAIISVNWETNSQVFPCRVYLQGSESGIDLSVEETEQFKAAFDKLLTLEQMGEAMQQRQAAIDMKEAQINQVWAQVQNEAARQALQKGGGWIKGKA